MGLIFNLPGAIQHVQTSRTNKEKIEAVNRLTEEFYRTIGILLYARFFRIYKEENFVIDNELKSIIQDHFMNPTFDQWIRIGRILGEKLISKVDKFAIALRDITNQEIQGKEKQKAKSILKEIHNLRFSTKFTPPKKLTNSQITEVMRLLRNYRSHEWDDNPTLKPLIDLEIENVIVTIVERIFENVNIKVMKPISIESDKVECVEQYSVNKKIVFYPIEDDNPPILSNHYLKFFEDERNFEFPTNLIYYDQDTNKIFTYLKFKNEKELGIFECVPIIGGIEKTECIFSSIFDVFGLTSPSKNDEMLEETLEQKYGRIEITNDIIHNVQELVEDYVERENVEKELFEKLIHRRLYVTTIDGGGGFGKSELAKKVTWDIINKEEKLINIKDLNFKYIVWVTGKLEFFREGSIEIEDQSFSTVEDLIDSIFYVTGNQQYISENLQKKREYIFEVLNASPSTLLLLDNLETVPEKDDIWNFIIELGDKITSEIKVIITSRTRGGYAEQRLNVRAMEPEEAKNLAISELKRHDVPAVYLKPNKIKKLIEATGSIPLLIRHSSNLLSRAYNLDEIIKNLPKDSDKALNFMFNFQFNELTDDSKKLLMGIAYLGGKMTFMQAKFLSGFGEKQFYEAKENLQAHSFLIDKTLIDSILSILPPIVKYAKMKLKEFPEFEEDFLENKKFLYNPFGKQNQSNFIYSDEIALNLIFQRAELLAKRGNINEAYDWYKQATARFPESFLAWRSRGEFEYRYFSEENYGEESFSKAVPLNPKDPITYSSWAYWEFNRGSANSEKLHLKKAIELNEKAMNCYTQDEDIRKAKDFVASTYMKLGYITKEEIYRTFKYEKKREIINEMKIHFKNAINILTGNLILNPNSNQDIHHNVIDFAMLSTAYLSLGSVTKEKRDSYDNDGLYYLLQAFKLDYNEAIQSLRYTIGHPGIISSLKKYGVQIHPKNIDKKMINKVSELETKVKLIPVKEI